MASKRNRIGNLGAALRDAGIEPARCEKHKFTLPCNECLRRQRDFDKAEMQRARSLQADQKAAHEQWLRERGPASVQRARQQMKEQDRG